ncbi:MAG: helix-turn-helix domain-containing protein [Succinatimonas sp.]|nr:helix-turn-helix domain-containing protein [Succinatimonas sp.]
MENDNLITILKILGRENISQSSLVKRLQLSKSRISFLCKNLSDLNLIERSEGSLLDDEPIAGRPVQLLRLKPQRFYSAIIINTTFEQSINICEYGKTSFLLTLKFKAQSASDLALEAQILIKKALDSLSINKNLLLAIVVATQASLEQGENGTIFRDNVLIDTNFNLSGIIKDKTGIRTFVYNYAYSHLLCLQHSHFTNTDHAIALMCGEGSVALGIFINGKILLGPNNTFTECSALPFTYGFEKSLGTYGPHTKEALLFAIEVLAPIFKIYRIFLSGSTFDNNLEVIREIQIELKNQTSPILSQIKLEYWDHETRHFMREFMFLSFDKISEIINPQFIKHDLNQILSHN